jgi:hypothetical protein
MNRAGSGLEHDNHLDLIGKLVFPSIERPRGGKDRTARDQPAIEQRPNELDGLVSVGKRS